MLEIRNNTIGKAPVPLTEDLLNRIEGHILIVENIPPHLYDSNKKFISRISSVTVVNCFDSVIDTKLFPLLPFSVDDYISYSGIIQFVQTNPVIYLASLPYPIFDFAFTFGINQKITEKPENKNQYMSFLNLVSRSIKKTGFLVDWGSFP